ncbi:30S ribosome-binding factor RbfA [Pseudotabrizicola sp. 4114]|uniref:30S ribosome-binding factor RbfA n=1 Tax=Pseudotabrizicola sp. 4114 TaxID=2817731 RepID=UPI00285CD4F2|nr:ribosome-binding factor A [Pseudorhodobacter sp. 4114]
MAPMSNKRNSPGDGPNQRQLRVGELIRRTLADVLNRAEIHDPELNRMSITVGEVSCSTDLKVATVYVMPLMGSVPVEDAIAALARNKAELRHRVASQLTLKYAPDLRFRPDETFDRLDETRRLFADPKVIKDLAAPDEEPEGDAPDGRDGTA